MDALKGTLTRILGKSLQKQLNSPAINPLEDSLSCGDIIMTTPSAKWRDISLKVDLYNAASQYQNFLNRCRHHREFLQEEFLPGILHRYEHYWLPLLAEWQQADLEPPMDIHWIWHLHMLLPGHYSQHCKEKYGRVLPHRVRLNITSTLEGLDRTRAIWKDNYPNEPFDADLKNTKVISLNGSKLTELVSFAKEQTHFLYQVALPHYSDSNFLFRALDRYKQLLLLKSQKPRITLKLPVDIQLIWRTHLLHPIEYWMEIQNLLGPFSVESLGDCDYDVHMMLISDSNDIWRTFYQEPLFINGTSFRGLNLDYQVRELPKKLYAHGIIDSCSITIDDVCVSDLYSKDKKIIIECRRLGDSSFVYKEIFKVPGVSDKTVTSQNHNGLATMDFEAKIHRGIEFNISAKKGTMCTSGERHLATVFYNPHKHFHNQSFVTGIIPVEVPKVSYTDPKLTFTMKVTAAVPNPHVLTMDRDPFAPGMIPNALKVFVESLPQWAEAINQQQDGQEFLMAKHRMKSKRGMLAFAAHLTRQDDAELNSVMLYHNNEHLVCMAHSIGAEQLPKPEQVRESIGSQPLTFDPEEGDQAMLIRNHLGDWAVCVARWHVNNVFSGEGQVSLRIHFLQTQAQTQYNIRDDELQTIKCGQVTVDMPSGKFIVDATCQELAEHVTLAFCTGMLFVTCQRRSMSTLTCPTPNGSIRSSRSFGSTGEIPTSDMPRESSSKRSFGRFSAKSHMNRKKLNKRRKMSASFTFLLASGLQIDVAVSGSVGPSRSGSRSSSYSKGSVRTGHHPDVTTINFDQTVHQKQIEDQVKWMIEGDRYYSGANGQYYPSQGTDSAQEDDQTYWDIRL